MPWTLCRLTANLDADGAWHGLARDDASAPASGRPGDAGASIFFQVGGQGGAVVTGDLEVMIRVGWCTGTGSLVAGAGTSVDVEPVTIDALPHPANPGQLLERLCVGEAREAAAWMPLYLRVGPAALASVRLSNMVYASATRVAVWYWSR